MDPKSSTMPSSTSFGCALIHERNRSRIAASSPVALTTAVAGTVVGGTVVGRSGAGGTVTTAVGGVASSPPTVNVLRTRYARSKGASCETSLVTRTATNTCPASRNAMTSYRSFAAGGVEGATPTGGVPPPHDPVETIAVRRSAGRSPTQPSVVRSAGTSDIGTSSFGRRSRYLNTVIHVPETGGA